MNVFSVEVATVVQLHRQTEYKYIKIFPEMTFTCSFAI